jgi:hypothetical protein
MECTTQVHLYVILIDSGEFLISKMLRCAQPDSTEAVWIMGKW